MELILIGVFILSTVLGYFLIKNVPSLLHTPLMSGMNALSGITILGSVLMTVVLVESGKNTAAIVFGGLAIVLATINVVGGFMVTNRMLAMFKKRKDK
ncbi:MAG: NAD(P) transhydrogenase subunit alpha [Bacilli bacterium]